MEYAVSNYFYTMIRSRLLERCYHFVLVAYSLWRASWFLVLSRACEVGV